jgi:hypothetical protein
MNPTVEEWGEACAGVFTFWWCVLTWWTGMELFASRSLIGPGVITHGCPIHVGASSIAAHKGLEEEKLALVAGTQRYTASLDQVAPLTFARRKAPPARFWRI